MNDNSIDVDTVKYVSFDGMVKLWLKIIQIGFSALKLHSRIMNEVYPFLL